MCVWAPKVCFIIFGLTTCHIWAVFKKHHLIPLYVLVDRSSHRGSYYKIIMHHSGPEVSAAENSYKSSKIWFFREGMTTRKPYIWLTRLLGFLQIFHEPSQWRKTRRAWAFKAFRPRSISQVPRLPWKNLFMGSKLKTYKTMFQGLKRDVFLKIMQIRVNRKAPMIFMGKSPWFPVKIFPTKPIHWVKGLLQICPHAFMPPNVPTCIYIYIYIYMYIMHEYEHNNQWWHTKQHRYVYIYIHMHHIHNIYIYLFTISLYIYI